MAGSLSYWNKAPRGCIRWPRWLNQADRARLCRLAKRARVYSRDGTYGVRLLVALVAGFRKGRYSRFSQDRLYHWSLDLGLSLMDFLGGGWENNKPLHPVAQAALAEVQANAARWEKKEDLDNYPREVKVHWQPSWSTRPPGRKALGLAEFYEAHHQAAYFFSALLKIADRTK